MSYLQWTLFWRRDGCSATRSWIRTQDETKKGFLSEIFLMARKLSFFLHEMSLKCSLCIRLRFTIDEGIRCDTPHGYLRDR